MRTIRRVFVTLPAIAFLATSLTAVVGTAAASAASAPTIEGAGSATLAVRQLTRGAAGGPFHFELSDGATPPSVHSGGATTTADGDAVDVSGLVGTLAPGTYTLRQDLTQLPTDPTGGHWEFTGVECDGAPVTVDATTGSATITLDPSAGATCTVTDTWSADDPPAPTTTTTTTTPGSSSGAAAAATVAADPVITPLASPIAATITVSKSGVRATSSTKAPLPGSLFALYASQTDAVNDTNRLATCTTLSDGKCSMNATGTGTRDVFVREVTSPAGYFRLNTISTGTSSATGDSTTSAPYIERVNVQNNNTYLVPVEQPLSGGGTFPRTFANGLNNPPLSPACGLNVAMVFDVSQSINSTEMTNMKSAAQTFVTTLTGTPSQIAMFSFGTKAPAAGAPANLPLTSVASGNGPVLAYINGLPANPSSTSNRTNWDSGLFQVAQSTASFNVVLMLTDGNPTVWSPNGIGAPDTGSSAQVVRAGVEEAVASANAVKQEGAHVISIGIGSNLPVDNLTAISGPGDAFVTNFDQLAAFLEQLATAACQGSVTIVKEAQPRGAPGFSPAGGWTFNTASAGVTPTSGTTAAGTGATNFKVDFSTSSAPKTISFDEVLQPGWNLVQQGGQNAKCTTQALTSTRSSSNAGPTGFNVTVGPNDIVSCLVRNQQQSLPTLTLRKVVVNNNGGTAQPTAWTLNANGPTALSGATGSAAVTNVVVPAGTYNLSESNGPPGYTPSAWSCTGAASSTATSVTLSSTSAATCTITNDDQPAHLTLVKQVQNNFGGTALPTAWTLHANGPTTISGVTGSAAVTNAAVSAGSYTISESNGPPGYASGAWDCTSTLRSAFRTAQAITLNVGENLTCTLVNFDAPAHLTLQKTVVNNNGGTAPATAWTLTANGPEILSGSTGSPAVTAVQVPIGTYALSETGGPAGYAASAWSCTGATQFTGSSVTLDIGQSATCTITNDDIAAHLTLSKAVINDNGGTALPTAWTLNAVGPTTGISGATGTAPVTGVQVLPGTYALSESGPGPPGYAASPWACTGAAVSTGTSVTPALGENVFCAIVNDDQPALLTLVKQVTNDNGGTAQPTDWILSAQGATTGISGVTGTASVTNVGVLPGSYALSETGPSGYTASAWSCVGGTQTGASIAVALGQSAVCTITNNDIPARLTLVKTVVNDSGGTAAATAWTLSANGPTPISGATGSAAVTAAPVSAGTYNLFESGPGGYAPSAWSCVGGTQTGASIALGSGQSATCTITNNDQPAQLTLVKQVVNDNGGTAAATAWTLTANGPTPISGATGSAAVTAAPVSAGTYNLFESGPGGYAPSAWSCVGGTQTGSSIAVALGQSATCTITNNDIPARLTLVKTVTNDNGGTAAATDWTLTATGPTPISGVTGSATVTNASVSAGTYALTEAGPAGYTASAWSCVGGTQTGSSIAVALGQSAVCTITNNDQAAHLTLVKQVVNDNGGTAAATAWTLTANGPTPISGATGSATVTAAPVSAGTYNLFESGPGGYAPSAWSCVGGTQTGSSITVALGQSATCTITNNDIPARLTLVKTVTNDNGGTALPTDWTLTATGPTPISGATGSAPVTNALVSAGTYALTETGGPAGYASSAWSCTGGTLTGANIALALGQSATCTINNNDAAGQLTLVKVVVNDNGGTAAATAWTLSANGPTPISGATGSAAVTAAPVSAGTYNLFESGPGGYAPSAWSCVGGTQTGSSITVALGQSATCTITNNDIPAQLTLVKTVVNDNGGTAAATDWTLNANGPTPISGATGSATVTAAPVSAGTYALTEAGPAGYTASAWSCVGGTQTGASIALALGQSATCTIDNNDIAAQLTLVKTVTNDNGGTAAATDWTLNANGATPISGTTGSAAVTAAPVSAGTYNLFESGPGGYAPSAWSCVGGTQTGSSITVALGQSATCTIDNNDIAAQLTLVKTVTNDNGGTAAATDWTLNANGPTPISGATGSAAVTAAPVSAGTYNLFESGPGGYAPSAWSCVGGTQTGSSITVALGQSATCTIDNNDIAAQLTLVKTVTNDNGGTALPTDWTLTATGPTPISGTTGSATVTAAPVSAGTYALTETGPAGYTASAWSCVGGTQTGASIALALGQSATCTIDNNDIAAQLTLVKTVTNDNGGTAAATDWTLTATGPTPISGTTGSATVTAAPVSVGTYALTETGPAGYTPSAWTCTGGTQTGASIALALGQSATCTITNDDIPARLTLVKEVINDDGGTAVPTDWTLTADGPTPISGVTGDASVTDAPVDAGTYALSESDVAGYVPTALLCVGGTWTPGESTIALANGESATCTITNDDLQAEISIVKTSSATAIMPGSTVPYSFAVTNPSATSAQDVIVQDRLPVGLSFVSSPDGCTADAAQIVTCDIGALAAGTTATRNIVTQAANPFPPGSVDPDGLVPNTATVTATDTNCPPLGRAVPTTPAGVGALQATADDCASTDPLPLLPTLTITKTSTATEIVPGAPVPYTIVVTNTGPVVAPEVVVTDTLPAGLSYVSSVPACTATGQVVTCPLGDLAAGTSASIDLVTLAQNPFPVVNGQVINVAVVVGSNSNCGEASRDPVCRAESPLPVASVAGESVEPANGNGNGNGDGGLPFTGSSNLPTFIAGACLFVGLALVGVARRRRRPHSV